MLFGNKLRQLRENQRLVLKKVAAELDIDTATMSKIERGEHNANREYLLVLSELFGIREEELKRLWLDEKVGEIVSDEEEGLEALEAHMKYSLTYKKAI